MRGLVALCLVASGVATAAVPPPTEIPTLAELEAVGRPDPRASLKLYCDWLLDHRRADGFLEVNTSEWYRASYPVRTLLAGYEIFGDARYLNAATDILDRLLLEQLPNAAWFPRYLGRPTASRTPAELEQIMSTTTNTADIGCIVTCLSVAARHDSRRRGAYVEAHRRYAEEYALRFQLPSGGFTNGRWRGQDMTVPYSVATGTQGMSFVALHLATGEPAYLAVAERAVAFLLEGWKEDGRPLHHVHDRESAPPNRVTAFGDVYYYHEAILWVWHWTKDERLKERIRQVYGWHIHGSLGLLQARQHEVWWPPTNPWENSKAGGMPQVLLAYGRRVKDPLVDDAIGRASVFLSHPPFAERVGIMADPGTPWGQFAMAATGFAGLTLAELVRPGIVYQKSEETPRAPRKPRVEPRATRPSRN